MRPFVVSLSLAACLSASGCYAVHERGRGSSDAGEGSDARASDAAVLPVDGGRDALVSPECVMSGGCTDPGVTIVLTRADPEVDGPGCVDVDVMGSDAVDCSGPITPIRIVRCAGNRTIFYATVLSASTVSPLCGVVYYFDDEAPCRCDLSSGGLVPCEYEGSSIPFGALWGRPVLDLGVLGAGVSYRLRACALE